MGLASLDAALSGLRVSQQQINVVSNNVANVGTPGFTRKILPQSAQAINGETVGVRGETIIRVVDLNLSRDLWTQVSAVDFFDIQQTYLNRIQQFHGPPDQELSVASELSRLLDTFIQLADTPEDAFTLANTVNQAEDTAEKIRDLSELITTLRNDAQDEIDTTVTRINDLLEQIASLNDQIEGNINVGRTSALLEDSRDEAIKELSGLIEISFFQRGDGVIVVQTNNGAELASDTFVELTFTGAPLSAQSYYPDSANGVFVGDPNTDNFAVDITELSPGGKLGGLLELRDTTFPKQMAQLDELAHKIALRFEDQGLMLFTDASGNIPGDTAPDPTALPTATPVEYVGFSAVIQVNENIVNDNSLLQTGTYSSTIQAGDNEVIRRVIQNTFGSVEFQQAMNTDTDTQVDIRASDYGFDLQNWLGLFSSNEVEGGLDLSSITDVNALIASAGGALDPPNDQFDIIFSELRPGVPIGPIAVTIDLSDAALVAGATALDQLVTHINSEIALAGVPASLASTAVAGANGQLVIQSRGSIEIDSTTAGIGQAGLNFLGLTDTTGNPQAPIDPYFDIQVGNNPPTRITIEPDDDHTDLLTKLAAVEGLAIDTINFAIDGILNLRPGDDFDNPDFGGDLTIVAGDFVVNGANYNAAPGTTRTTIDDGANIISALFGTYTGTGATLQDTSPISNIDYTSETDASLAIPIPTLAFRETLLGPNADISTQIIGSDNLIDFAQKMVNEHSQSYNVLENRKADEESLRELLQTQLLDESGVNIDEELGNLIVLQTAYSASARVLTAVDELFQELLSAFR